MKIRDLGDTVQENAYDARGFRIVIKSYTSGTLSETRHVYYTDGWQAVEERLGSSTTPDRQFVWGAGYIDSLILRDRTTTSTLDERLYALQDANWNVTALVDTDGDVQQRMEYDPYGNPRFFQADYTPTTNGYAWEYLFTGRTYDSGTQLYQFRNRFYSSELGLFMTRDPIGYADGMNLYRGYFVPNGVDPLGRCQIPPDDPEEEAKKENERWLKRLWSYLRETEKEEFLDSIFNYETRPLDVPSAIAIGAASGLFGGEFSGLFPEKFRIEPLQVFDTDSRFGPFTLDCEYQVGGTFDRTAEPLKMVQPELGFEAKLKYRFRLPWRPADPPIGPPERGGSIGFEFSARPNEQQLMFTYRVGESFKLSTKYKADDPFTKGFLESLSERLKNDEQYMDFYFELKEEQDNIFYDRP